MTTGSPSVMPALCMASSAALSSLACISSVIFQLLDNKGHHGFGYRAQMLLAGASQRMGQFHSWYLGHAQAVGGKVALWPKILSH